MSFWVRGVVQHLDINFVTLAHLVDILTLLTDDLADQVLLNREDLLVQGAVILSHLGQALHEALPQVVKSLHVHLMLEVDLRQNLLPEIHSMSLTHEQHIRRFCCLRCCTRAARNEQTCTALHVAKTAKRVLRPDPGVQILLDNNTPPGKARGLQGQLWGARPQCRALDDDILLLLRAFGAAHKADEIKRVPDGLHPAQKPTTGVRL
mmetsp:Transcript_12818/g.45384  ORF Transcript_12818/g.45384 Transcript_12818/m.45384 type:complete len:207 (+) Transcript_12818:639-1259(+)